MNEEWISDKTRFAYDGLKRQRLISPMVKFSQLESVKWDEALMAVAEKVSKYRGCNVVNIEVVIDHYIMDRGGGGGGGGGGVAVEHHGVTLI